MTIIFVKLKTINTVLYIFFLISVFKLFIIRCHKNVSKRNIILNSYFEKEQFIHRKNNEINKEKRNNDYFINIWFKKHWINKKNKERAKEIVSFIKKRKICFVHFINGQSQANNNEKGSNLSDNLKNYILLFGRIAEYYYPKTVEQFHVFKEPYSKYINTKIDKNKLNKKWKLVFNYNNNSDNDNDKTDKENSNVINVDKQINKTIFHERICDLEFKWPINKNENIIESEFYNSTIEKCISSIEIIRHNINKLQIFLQKLEEKNNNENGTNEQKEESNYLLDLYKEMEKDLLEKGELSSLNYFQNINEKNQLNTLEKLKKLEKLQSIKKIGKLEKLGKITMNNIFQQKNRAYSRLLLNEVFSIDTPSKKITDAFLHLVFQKNVDEFTFKNFAKYLKILGKKMEIYNCNNDSNIYFDHFFVLMERQLQDEMYKNDYINNQINRHNCYEKNESTNGVVADIDHNGNNNNNNNNNKPKKKIPNFFLLNGSEEGKIFLEQLEDSKDESTQNMKLEKEQREKRTGTNETEKITKQINETIFISDKEACNKAGTTIKTDAIHKPKNTDNNKIKKYISKSYENFKSFIQKKLSLIVNHIRNFFKSIF